MTQKCGTGFQTRVSRGEHSGDVSIWRPLPQRDAWLRRSREREVYVALNASVPSHVKRVVTDVEPSLPEFTSRARF